MIGLLSVPSRADEIQIGSGTQTDANLPTHSYYLLQTPQYRFEANPTDYASRFKLVFHSDSPTDDDFAFISNGNLVISGADHNATVQIVDATGRVVITCKDGIKNISTSTLTPGVYVLRLINEKGEKTQKIVIK